MARRRNVWVIHGNGLEVGTLATIKSLKKPCIAGFMKPINSTPPPTPPLHHRSPPPTSSSIIVGTLATIESLKKPCISEGEPENRPLHRKKWTAKAVVIQEPSSVPVKQTQESSGKLKGRLKNKIEGSSEGIGTTLGVPDELIGKTAISDAEAGITPEVPNETKDIHEEKDESLDDEESDAEKDESDEEKSIDIENSDKEMTESDDDDTEVKKDEKTEEQKVDEEHKADEEHEGVEQIRDEHVVVPVLTTLQERPALLQSTSCHSVSSNFANQFIISPNASLIGTIPENTEAEIISMLDESTQQPPSTPPPPATETLATQVPNAEVVNSVVQIFSKMEQFVKKLKEADFGKVIHDSIESQVLSLVKKYLGSSLPDAFRKELQTNNAKLKKELFELNYKEVIEESMKAQVVKEVNNILPQLLPQAVSDFATPVIDDSIKATV
ncbi:hypothetical protein Tco_1254086 [Tanacetum coccineum]